MPENCIESDRLFQEYTDSINTHLEAVRRSHSAAVRQTKAALTESEQLENLALKERHSRRRALMEHEVSHLIHDLTTRKQVS